MSYAELVQLYFERSNALQWYWTLYVLVIGGLLAFSSVRKERDRATTLLITVLFCFFAYKNHGAIQDVTLQRQATLEALQQQAAEPVARQVAQHLEPTMLPADPSGVRTFHLLSDLVTLAALWTMELRRKRSQPKPA
jgi:hypothetical protein